MHIALVHMRHAHSGGTERYMNQLARYLADEGHQVTIICRSHEEAPHPAVRFEVLRPFAPGSTARMMAFASSVEKHLREQQYDVVFGLGKTWSQDVMRMGGGVQETYLEIGHSSKQNMLERWLGPGLKHRLALGIQRRALASGSLRRIITNSGWVKRDLMQRYAIADRLISVVHNGVDVERFHPRHRNDAGPRLRREWNLASDDFVVLFLGSGYARKGLDRVIAGFAQFAAERPDARLVVIGYDSMRPQYERQARAAGVADRCRFLGGRRDAEACFGAADLYMIPTRFDPFANSTLEALATGVPVITTPTNGAAEIMTPGLHGSIIQTDAELLDAMRYWYPRARDPATRAATRALAESFPATLTARRSAEVLEEVAREKRAVGK